MQPDKESTADVQPEADRRAADEGFGYYELLPDPFHEPEAGVLGRSAQRKNSPPSPRGERGAGG